MINIQSQSCPGENLILSFYLTLWTCFTPQDNTMSKNNIIEVLNLFHAGAGGILTDYPVLI